MFADLSGINETTSQLRALLEQITEAGVHSSNIVLGGFSQVQTQQ